VLRAQAIRSAPLLARRTLSPVSPNTSLIWVVQLLAVRDDQNTPIRQVLADPTGQHHHDQALAGSLSLPDDPALTASHTFMGGLHSEILIGPRDLLDARIKQREVVDQFKKPRGL
jgi:hypothetical protein